MGVYSRNVGNYASGFNSLGMSVQQIVRELPAATMGLNMFFLAISNNLPILTDEIKRAAEANKALKAQNQETIPVWKQLVSSIFSWQTALIVAITAMSMYGKEIVSWIGNLFKAKDATEEVRIEQEKLNKSMADARKSAAEETAGLRTLYAMTQNQNASMQDRLAAVNKLQQQYPAYFGNISKEAILAGQASAAYQQLTKDIMAAAYARAYQDRISDLAAKNIDNYNKSLSQYNYLISRQGAYNAAKSYMDSEQSAKDRRDYQRSRAGWTYDTEAVERYENALRTLDEYEEHRSRWQRYNENYKRNEAIMADYEKEIQKRQSALMKTEQGSDYVEDTKSQENEAKRIAKERERIAKERLKAQSDVDKDLLSLQQKNQDDEIALMQDGTRKRLAEIDNDYKKRTAEIDRQEVEFKKKNKEAGATGLTGGLTQEQQTALQEARDNAAKEQERQTNEIYLAEAQAMRDYLKQYGTFQQQKLAIAEEYAEKIKKAQSEGERLSLTAERDRSLQQIEINAIRQNIDWGSVFGDFGTMFKDQLQPTIDQLRQIAQSDTFRQSSIEDQKTLYELIDKLEQSNAVWDSDIFKRVSDDIKAYQQAMENYTKAINDARKAEADYVNAQKAHDAALKAGNSSMIQAAQAAVDETRSAYMAASEQVKTFGTQVQNTTTDLNSSALQAKSMFENLADGLQGLSSGSLQGIGNGIMQLDKLFRGGELTKDAGNAIAKGFQSLLGKDSKAAKVLSEALGSSGLAGQIISAILGMLDILAQGGIGGLVSNLYDTVSNAVNGILEDVLSGGIITKPLNSVVQGAKNILNTITFGGLNSWLGGNDKAVMETVNRLTESNEYLRESIDRLRERISDSGATNEQSVEYYNQAREAEEEWEENQRDIIKSLAKAWTNWGYGAFGLSGKKSFNSHAPGGNWEGWDAFTETLRNNGINITIDEVGDLWNLTPEQMALLRDNNPKEWQKLFSGDGHKNPKSAVEEYIERAGTLEELTNALNEKLTGYSWDGFLDQYKSLIKEMEGDMSDFGDFINETISNALIEAFVNERLQDDIKDLYEYIANAASDGLSEEEIEEIRRRNEDIANKAAAWKESMVEAGLIAENTDKTQQSASSKGFETMSQDMAGELSGRFTALNETGLRIEAQGNAKMQTLADLKGSVAGLEVQAQGIYNIADETRSILANSYLELQEINENTGNSAKYLKDIKTDIAIVKQNTSRI